MTLTTGLFSAVRGIWSSPGHRYEEFLTRARFAHTVLSRHKDASNSYHAR